MRNNSISAVASGLARVVPPVAIPTLSGSAMLMLAGLLGLGALVGFRRASAR